MMNPVAFLKGLIRVGNIQDVVALEAAHAAQGKELQEVRSDLATTRDVISLRGKLKFRNNALWLTSESDESSGPFCSVCVDVHGKAVHMTRRSNHYAVCGHCNNGVDFSGTPSAAVRVRRVISSGVQL